MHLALVVEDPASNKGPDTQANNLLKSLDTYTDTVDEITVICKDGASPDYRSSNISTADILDADQPVTSLQRVFDCCRTVDLVHVFAANWRIVLAVMGLSRAPVLLGTSTTFRALPHRIAVRFYRPTAVFASIEPFETAISEMGYRRDRTFFIPNGIDTDIFTPPGQEERDKIRRTLGDRHELSLEESIIIWVNHLNSHKRPLLALRAFQRFRQQRDDVSLLMIGDGPQRAAVEDMVKSIPGAHCLGFIDHDVVHDYYRVADINLVTSRSEGISNVVYEGMACGLPALTVTAFDQVGTGEHGRYLSPSASKETIVSGMAEILQRREELGQQARYHVVQNHGLKTFADRYEQLYQWCLGRGSKPTFDETWKADTINRIKRN